ncbi:unnamed protein product [Prorocentrum cordatum]|uniref:Uncharacterized protein n=1 Tax=Prorocentrum cordatum TaxID=2364126 RepID=A0ABN9P6P7_9DINO|nr:unnamed protein product [Polarella glacialis]
MACHVSLPNPGHTSQPGDGERELGAARGYPTLAAARARLQGASAPEEEAREEGAGGEAAWHLEPLGEPRHTPQRGGRGPPGRPSASRAGEGQRGVARPGGVRRPRRHTETLRRTVLGRGRHLDESWTTGAFARPRGPRLTAPRRPRPHPLARRPPRRPPLSARRPPAPPSCR